MLSWPAVAARLAADSPAAVAALTNRLATAASSTLSSSPSSSGSLNGALEPGLLTQLLVVREARLLKELAAVMKVSGMTDTQRVAGRMGQGTGDGPRRDAASVGGTELERNSTEAPKPKNPFLLNLTSSLPET